MSWFEDLLNPLGVIGTIIGGVDDKNTQDENAARAERQRAESKKFIEDSLKQSKGALFKLFPQAMETRRQGLNLGLGLIQDRVPAQQQAYNEGNRMAQQQIAGAYPDIRNAITGGLVNYNPQPMQVQPPQMSSPQLPNVGLPGGLT